MSKKKCLILGSFPEGRTGKYIANWAIDRICSIECNIDFELVDLEEVNLPFLDEPVSPMMSDDYQFDYTKAWSKRIKAADSYIFITPEYNRGYPAVIKNAIDFLFNEWKGKPVAFVGYGGSGAKDAIRQLREVVLFIGMKALDSQVGVYRVWEAFDNQGNLKEDYIEGSLHSLISEMIDSF